MAAKEVKAKLIQRSDTETNWNSENPVLAVGEIGYDKTNKNIKIGDGTTAWSNLPYRILGNNKTKLNSSILYSKTSEAAGNSTALGVEAYAGVVPLINVEFSQSDDEEGNTHYYVNIPDEKFVYGTLDSTVYLLLYYDSNSTFDQIMRIKGYRFQSGSAEITLDQYNTYNTDTSFMIPYAIITSSISNSYSFINDIKRYGEKNGSHSEGVSTISVNGSHAEGFLTLSLGNYSHAEGYETVASGQFSHAEGYKTMASRIYSHSEGSMSQANGSTSHVEGGYTIASSDYQHVQGKYNIEDINNTYAHIVGNGTSETSRSNAHTIDWNGNAWFSGTVTVGTDNKELATKEYVDNHSGGGSGTITTITTDMIEDSAVTPSKTNFFVTNGNENLYDTTDVDRADNYFLTSNGGLSSHTSYSISGYIPVNEGDVVHVRYFDTSTNSWSISVTSFRSVIGYDSSKTVKTSTYIQNSKYYTVPSGVYYVRVCVYKTAVPMVTINDYPEIYVEHSSITKLNNQYLKINNDVIEDNSVTSDKTDFFINNGNLFNPNDPEVLNGYYIHGDTGIISASSNYKTTGFIPVTPGDVVVCSINYGVQSGERVSTSLSWFVAFDRNKIPVYGYYDISSYTVPDGIYYIRVSLNNDQWTDGDTTKVQIETTGRVSSYKPYGEILDTDYVKPEQTVYAWLPDEICVASGRTIELYNKEVCINADKYHMQWDCDIGLAYARKFSITGTDDNIGNHTLTLSIYDDNLEKLWEKTTTIKVVSNSNSGAPYPICTIGNSLTNGKKWITEIAKLSDNNFFSVGTRWNGFNKDSGIRHEGRSGASATWYLGNNTYGSDSNGVSDVNPFYDTAAGRFSWTYYLNTYFPEGTRPSNIIIYLGTNNLKFDPTQNANAIKEIVDDIRLDNSTIPIFVVNTIFPSLQDGFAGQKLSDGYAGALQGKFEYKEYMKIYNLQTRLYDLLKGYSDVHFIPLSICHDSEYNFGSKTIPINPRSTETVTVPIESIHPQEEGFLQMADVIFSSLCAYADYYINV